MQNKKLNTAFTYIEMMVTVVIVAICFVPLIQVFSDSIAKIGYAGDKLTALNLARDEMEKIKNLNLTEAQFISMGNVIIPAKDKPPLKRNKAYWRIERILKENSDPLEVRVIVYRQGKEAYKVLELATLIEDLEWSAD
ncbi:MAG: hypothetical protein COV72_02430 [Candidatus Omnitrophica bacterium CG11_big_fil_rev_8_21_14_0_20_42_13]|uniref:Type II secretion system protein GspI C-terminal domain-containing protein n=1 Tax=Candidatus Ghiorseimicrobium undicola TaxID=1974746 RepID=A0A2H0LYP0_9BACT|nr:MAG: hypothetical protein COV72_02430 [Candidatus Omnitrophica bacterium CG11_big_fil_rev_8_21_14_0_20_42_13]